MKLFIDTSFRGVYVALFSDQQLIWRGEYLQNSRSSIALDSLVECAFQSVGCKWDELSDLYLSSGPGSFTGVKIGMSYSQGLLGFDSGIKFRPFSNFLEFGRFFSAKHASFDLFLPITRTNLFLLRCIEGHLSICEIALQENEELEFFAIDTHSVKGDLGMVAKQAVGGAKSFIIDRCEKLEDFFRFKGIVFEFLPYESIFSTVLSECVAGNLEATIELNPRLFNPFYFKKSAPEERKLRKSKESK